MAIIFANVGELELLDKMLKDALTVDENITLKLYKTNVTPTQSSVAGDFTESDFTSYVSKALTRAGFNAATTVSNKASSTYGTAQTWTAGSSQVVYGSYAVGATSGVLLWAELFSSAVSLVSGDTLTYTPVLTLNSEN